MELLLVLASLSLSTSRSSPAVGSPLGGGVVGMVGFGPMSGAEGEGNVGGEALEEGSAKGN